MKKRIISLLIAIVMVLLIAVPVLATAYSYNLTIVNTGGALTNTPFLVTMPNTAMAANGFMAANARDTQVLDGTAVLPHLVCDDKTLFVGNIAAGQTKTFQFTSGNTPAASMPIIVGQDGYVTIPYNANLEPGSDDFQIEISGYFDTSPGTDKYILNQVGGITIQVTANQQITATITTTGGDIVLVVNGVSSGYHTLILSLSAGVYTLDVNGNTDIFTNNTTVILSPVEVGQLVCSTGGNYAAVHNAANGTIYGTPAVGQNGSWMIHRAYGIYDATTLAGFIINSASLKVGYASNYSYPIPFFVYRVDGSSMVYPIVTGDYGTLLSETTPLDIFSGDGPATATLTIPVSEIITNTEIKFAFRERYDVLAQDLTACGVAQCSDLTIDYGTAIDSVVDPTTVWTIDQNNVMPYINSFTMHVATGDLLYEPAAIISGTYLPVRDGLQAGTITWGTGAGTPTGNPPGTSTAASGGDIITVTTPPPNWNKILTGTSNQEYWKLMDATPGTPTHLYTELGMGFFGGGFLQKISNDSGIPLALIVFPYAFGISLGLGLLAYVLTMGKAGRDSGGRRPWRGSLPVMAGVCLLSMTYFVIAGGGVIPGWSLIPVGLIALATILFRQAPQGAY
jgi:hypothetical protein